MKKAQFAAAIGMKPQTYNNFVGAQASKPSIDLIHGVVTHFQADPQWLINGTGPMYLRARDTGGGHLAETNPALATSARWTHQRAAQVGHMDVVREVISTLEELQVLLARLQSDLPYIGEQKAGRAAN
jgi:hypothetical protein